MKAKALALLCALLPAPAAAGEGQQIYLGEARDAKGALAYTEKHTVTFEGGKARRSLTEYSSPGGELIAVMDSDYSLSVAMPTYEFRDLARNYREGLRLEQGRYLIFSQEADRPEKTGPLTDQKDVFSCQGWHYYLVNNLDLLERDNIILNLVLPSELKPYPFVVKSLRSDENIVSAELTLRHWLFRYFAPRLRLLYDRKNRRLLEYHGISNIPGKDGGRQDVHITYTYGAAN
jgi:hypothetical protein